MVLLEALRTMMGHLQKQNNANHTVLARQQLEPLQRIMVGVETRIAAAPADP